jgi:outer membrane protein TolC
MKTTILTLAVITGISLFHGDSLAAAEVSPPPSVPSRGDEQSVNKNLQTWLQEGENLNAAQWQWLPINVTEVVRRALRENLTLKKHALTVKMAGETLKEVRANSFDPIFSVAGSYANTKTYNRNEWGFKNKKATTRCPEEGDKVVEDEYGSLVRVIKPVDADFATSTLTALVAGDPWICLPAGATHKYDEYLFVVYPTTSPVHYLRFDTVRAEGDYLKKAEASEADPEGQVSETSTMTLGVSKAFPWGVDVAVKQTNTHTEKKWVLNPSGPSPTRGSYDRPWISSLNASASIPMPGGKNFGEHSLRDTNVKLAALDHKRAESDYQNGEITLIQEVQKAFWDMVRGVRVLNATIENRKTVELLVEKTKTLFKQQRITQYNMLQVESELERVKSRETTAWNDYIAASNILNMLLNHPEPVLFLPVEYGTELAKLTEMGLSNALQHGDQNNPSLHSQSVMVKQAGLRLKLGENQAQPDVSVNTSVSATQSNALFGYETLGDSMGNLLDPDNIALSANVAFHYPWGNSSAKALVNKSREQAAVSELDKRIARNKINRLIKNAHTTLSSALIRITMSERHLQLVEKAYKKAQRAQRLRRVTEYEIISKGGDVLDVEKQLILAQVDAKKAEIDLLAAMGALDAKLITKRGAANE